MILHFGVVDLPYVGDAPSSRAPKKRNFRRRAGMPPPEKPPATAQHREVTTGQVAEWLENRYHVMEVFFEENSGEIFGFLEESILGHLENLAIGAPVSGNGLHEGLADIEKRFRNFINRQEIEHLGIPGVPTKAALDGVSHRFKSRKGGRRPSFVDTGLYLKSFKAWMD